MRFSCSCAIYKLYCASLQRRSANIYQDMDDELIIQETEEPVLDLNVSDDEFGDYNELLDGPEFNASTKVRQVAPVEHSITPVKIIELDEQESQMEEDFVEEDNLSASVLDNDEDEDEDEDEEIDGDSVRRDKFHSEKKEDASLSQRSHAPPVNSNSQQNKIPTVQRHNHFGKPQHFQHTDKIPQSQQLSLGIRQQNLMRMQHQQQQGMIHAHNIQRAAAVAANRFPLPQQALMAQQFQQPLMAVRAPLLMSPPQQSLIQRCSPPRPTGSITQMPFITRVPVRPRIKPPPVLLKSAPKTENKVEIGIKRKSFPPVSQEKDDDCVVTKVQAGKKLKSEITNEVAIVDDEYIRQYEAKKKEQEEKRKRNEEKKERKRIQERALSASTAVAAPRPRAVRPVVRPQTAPHGGPRTLHAGPPRPSRPPFQQQLQQHQRPPMQQHQFPRPPHFQQQQQPQQQQSIWPPQQQYRGRGFLQRLPQPPLSQSFPPRQWPPPQPQPVWPPQTPPQYQHQQMPLRSLPPRMMPAHAQPPPPAPVMRRTVVEPASSYDADGLCCARVSNVPEGVCRNDILNIARAVSKGLHSQKIKNFHDGVWLVEFENEASAAKFQRQYNGAPIMKNVIKIELTCSFR